MAHKHEDLESRLNERVDGVNARTKDMADGLRNKGASERSLAAFVSLHEYINSMADSVSLPLNSKDYEDYMAGLQETIKGLNDSLIMGPSDSRAENQLAVGDKATELRKSIRDMIRGITPGGEIGSSGGVSRKEFEL